MKVERRIYRSPVRTRRAEDTRARILAALSQLVAKGGVDEVSFKAVAQAAGVTEITVFRHFPNREELLRALWFWLDERLGQRGMPQTERALVEDTPVVLASFDEHAPVIRAALLSNEGRAMRMTMQPDRRAAFTRALANATAGASAAEKARAHAVIQLLYSGYAWLSMRDHWGLDGREAGAASAWAIRVLIDELHRERKLRARNTNTSRSSRAKKTKTTPKNPT